LNKSI